MKKAWAWLRRHPFLVFLALALGAGAAFWLYVQSPTRLDMEHFNQIRVGMAADEVEGILGAPPGKFGIPNDWFAQTWFRWKARKGGLEMRSFLIGKWPIQVKVGSTRGPGAFTNQHEVRHETLVWQLTSINRFALITVVIDDRGRVLGAQLVESDF